MRRLLVEYDLIKYFQLDFAPRPVGLEIKHDEGRIQLSIMRSTVFVHMCRGCYVDVHVRGVQKSRTPDRPDDWIFYGGT